MPFSHVRLDAKVDEIFTYKKSYVSVSLVELLDILVCGQVSFGHCMFTILCCVECDMTFAGNQKFPQRRTRHVLSLRHYASNMNKKMRLSHSFLKYCLGNAN